jgi:hypothetical protein
MPSTNEFDELENDLELADSDRLELLFPPPAEVARLSTPDAEAVKGNLTWHDDAPETVGDVRERLDALPATRSPRAEYEKQCLEAILRAVDSDQV